MEEDKVSHTFKPGKKFSNTVDLYYFDKELRGVIFAGVISRAKRRLSATTLLHFGKASKLAFRSAYAVPAVFLLQSGK